MTKQEKYNKIKHLLPKIITCMGSEIEEMRKQGKESFWYNGLQCAIDSELKCEVRSTQIDSEMAYIVADYFGIKGTHYENIEPLHMKIRREKKGSILKRIK